MRKFLTLMLSGATAQSTFDIVDPNLHYNSHSSTNTRITCDLLTATGSNFYREIPVFLTKFVPMEEETLSKTHLVGNCWERISVKTTFGYMNKSKTELRAFVTINVN